MEFQASKSQKCFIVSVESDARNSENRDVSNGRPRNGDI